jgi:hypothetical protein
MNPRTLLLLFVALNSAAATADGEPQSDIYDPVFLYHSANLHEASSRKGAYVKLMVFSKCMELRCEQKPPNDPVVQYQLQRTYEESTAKMDGINYTDGYGVAVAKAMLGAAKVMLDKGAPKDPKMLAARIFADDKIAGKLIDGIARMASTPGEDPNITYGVALNVNIYGTKIGMNPKNPMSKFMNQADEKYNKRNLGVPIEMEPKVQEGLRFFTLKNTITEAEQETIRNQNRNTGKTVRHLEQDKKEYARRFGDLQQAAENGLNRANASLGKVVQYLESQQEKQIERAELERQRAEITSAYGLAGGLARLAGDNEAAEAFDRFGSFSGHLFDVMNSSLDFQSNPAAFANQYVMLLNLGVSLFTHNQEDPRWAGLFAALKALQEQIADLGKRMDRRFDMLEARLGQFVKDASERFIDLQGRARNSEENANFVKNALTVVQQETYGHFVLDSRLNWVKINNKCVQPRISRETFLDCRDQMALLAVETPPLGGKTPFDRQIVGRLARRMANRHVYPTDLSTLKDPASWLRSTQALLSMVAVNRHMISEINSQSPASRDDSQLSLDAMIEQGRYFGNLTSKMALEPADANGFRLRRDLIDEVFGDYKKSVQSALAETESWPNRYLPGGPHPNIPLEIQEPPVDEAVYTPLINLNAVEECDGEDRNRFTFHEYMGSSLPLDQMRVRAVREHFGKLNPSDYHLRRAFIPLLPKVLRFAMVTSKWKQESQFYLTACFREIHLNRLKELVRDFTPAGGDRLAKDNVEVTMNLEFSAHWMFNGRMNNLPVFRMVGYKLWDGHWADFYINTLWNGMGHYAPGITNDPASFFAANTPQNELADNLAQLERDFRARVKQVNDEVDVRTSPLIANLDLASEQSLKELSFIVERGLDNSNSSVAQLAAFLREESNLPKPSKWAEMQWSTGQNRLSVLSAFEKRAQAFKTLVNAVEAEKGLESGVNIFSAPVADLEALRSGRYGSEGAATRH